MEVVKLSERKATSAYHSFCNKMIDKYGRDYSQPHLFDINRMNWDERIQFINAYRLMMLERGIPDSRLLIQINEQTILMNRFPSFVSEAKVFWERDLRMKIK